MRAPSGEMLLALQAFTARGAITASSMRGGGAPGVVAAMREFLAILDLRPFGAGHEHDFDRALDEATRNLVAVLPPQAQRWGLARKGVNIFLRECLYNTYLRAWYHLEIAETWYEVPFDSITSTAIRREALDSVPAWRSVKGLTEKESLINQNAAAQIADQRGLARVHLDAVWWGQR